jgi:hypothetical protein
MEHQTKEVQTAYNKWIAAHDAACEVGLWLAKNWDNLSTTKIIIWTERNVYLTKISNEAFREYQEALAVYEAFDGMEIVETDYAKSDWYIRYDNNMWCVYETRNFYLSWRGYFGAFSDAKQRMNDCIRAKFINELVS